MEDILSSIKRIIAEDSEMALASPRAKRSVGLSPLNRGATEVADEADDVLELTDPVAVEPSSERAETPKPSPPVATAPKPKIDPMPSQTKPSLVSATTAEASRSSLAALSALIVKPEIAGSDTLEGMVRQMLQPMLAEWLDANLADIVERQVAQEIARISARG
jgi:uncharacterized protein